MAPSRFAKARPVGAPEGGLVMTGSGGASGVRLTDRGAPLTIHSMDASDARRNQPLGDGFSQPSTERKR